MKALYHDRVIAQSDHTVELEGTHYFPPDDVNWDYLKESTTTSTCPWKGQARYFNVIVDGKEVRDAAWHYPEPSTKAEHIKRYVAFWRGVTLVD